MIEGNSAYICDECVVLCLGVIEDGREKRKKTETKVPAKTPETIVDNLNNHVIGQDKAKKLIAIAVYNHYKRINNKKLDVDIQKSNVIIVGPTGSGKTLICSSIAKFLDVPFVQYDCTSLTEAGYVGDDVDQIIARLVVAADGDIARAQKGIVYLDEVDKIARSDSSGRDVRGEGVQQSLLKMIEGGVIQVNPKGGKKAPNADAVDIDTTNILFIVGGAFNSLTDTQNKNRNSVGFGRPTNVDKIERKAISHRDLIKFGMIPEFMGRLPVIAELETLSPEALQRILKEPKNSLVRQYQALFGMDGVELEFTDDYLLGVSELAIKEGTGARGLRAILEQSLAPHMYSIPSQKGKITKVTMEKSDLFPNLTKLPDNKVHEQTDSTPEHPSS